MWGKCQEKCERIRVSLFMTLAVVCSLGSMIRAEQPSGRQREPIYVEDLANRPVIGRLGVPLGRVVEIRAEIVDGRDLRQKAYDGVYLLRVTAVDSRPLAHPPILRFSAGRDARIRLASDAFELYKLKYGKRPSMLEGRQIAALEKGYVGRTVRLFAYETGGFSGIPENLPKGTPVWAGPRYHFSTSLVLLRQRE